MKYCFGIHSDDAVYVAPDHLYDTEMDDAEMNDSEMNNSEMNDLEMNDPDAHSGMQAALQYGFLTEKNRNCNKRLQIPELNSGYDTVYWYRGKELTCLKQDQNGCYVSGEMSGIPMTFISDVPEEGNYRVTVTLYAQNETDPAFIFLGRRRLAFIGRMGENSKVSYTFITNVCPVIPRGYTEEMVDLTIDLTVLGDGLHLQSVEIEPVDCQTIYIAGDSTVTDQSADYPYDPSHSYCGWGQMLSAYTGLSGAVSNHSHSGLTTESFRSEGHYRILMERIRKGDICLIQFGHNDQKLSHLTAEGGYRTNLIQYIEEIRDKGAKPVLVTPLARNTWKGNDGTYNDLLKDYAATCITLGREYEVPVIDLHSRSMELVKRLGREQVKAYYYPSDYTHSNDYGAYLFAGYVYEALVQLYAYGDVDHSDIGSGSVYQWQPPENMPSIEPPEDLGVIEDPNAEKLFEHLERPEEWLTRVEALELVITAMHFFPTNVYNDAFDDIVGHETYAGTVECAYQNGLIPDQMISNHRFLPEQDITGDEFLAIAENGYQSRKGKDLSTFSIDGIRGQKRIVRGKAADFLRILKI